MSYDEKLKREGNPPQDAFLNITIPEIDIPGRLETYKKILEILDEVDVQQFQLCLSGENKQFNAYFENPVILGRGYSGIVRGITLKSEPKITIAVKEFLLENQDIRDIMHLQDRWQTNRNQTVLREARILLLINNILFDYQCPNFLLTHGVAFCDSCVILPDEDEDEDEDDEYNRIPIINFCANIFMERASASLNDYTKTLKGSTSQVASKIMTSILHQLLIGLHCLQYRYQIFHGSLHIENVLIINIPHVGGYFKYIIGDDVYYVKNIGVLACISDFGHARSLHPSYCNQNKYLGERNVEIVDGKMIPLVDLDNGIGISWNSNGIETSGTSNQIFLDESYNFDRPVDWFDSLRFPPEYFFMDIRAIFKIISTAFHNIQVFPRNFSKTCKILSTKESFEIFRDLNQGGILLRADLMLKHLYIPPKLAKIPVIREYRIR